MAKVLCITGMHRSGTSLTASWLQECGLVIDDGLVYGAAPGNLKGHFEDKEFVDFHSKILKTKEGKSYGWKVYPRNEIYFTKSQLVEATQLIEKRNALYTTWAWKDPRTSLFLEQWKIVIPDLKVLLLWRPISEVVPSLLVRSRNSNFQHIKINFVEAVRLWCSYNRILCKYKRSHPSDTLFIPLTTLIENDQHVINLISSKLNINLQYIPINKVYSSKLLNKTNPRASILKSLFKYIPGVTELEEELNNLSDLNS